MSRVVKEEELAMRRMFIDEFMAYKEKVDAEIERRFQLNTRLAIVDNACLQHQELIEQVWKA